MSPKRELATEGITMPYMAAFYDLMVSVMTLGRERRFRREILKRAGVVPGDRVLDVGCGTGTLALLAAEAVGPEGEVVGVDATPQMVRKANKKAQRRRADVRFEEGLVEAIPAADSSFDLVMTTFTMHHFPGELKQRALAEMIRVLAPGGRLLIVDFPEHGHGHGARHHHGGDGGPDLTALVAEAGFEESSTGEMGMLSSMYLLARRPAC